MREAGPLSSQSVGVNAVSGYSGGAKPAYLTSVLGEATSLGLQGTERRGFLSATALRDRGEHDNQIIVSLFGQNSSPEHTLSLSRQLLELLPLRCAPCLRTFYIPTHRPENISADTSPPQRKLGRPQLRTAESCMSCRQLSCLTQQEVGCQQATFRDNPPPLLAPSDPTTLQPRWAQRSEQLRETPRISQARRTVQTTRPGARPAA